MLGFINGGASVSMPATASASTASAAATDCVDAVLEDLLIKKAFPQIAKLVAQAAVAQTASTTTSSSSSSTSTATSP